MIIISWSIIGKAWVYIKLLLSKKEILITEIAMKLAIIID